MNETNIVIAILTAALVVLTGWYAVETRRIVKRMEEEREALTRPLLTFQIIPWDASALKLRIQNLGNGPALDISGSIETTTRAEPAGAKWSYHLLGPGKYEEFGFPIPSGGSIHDRFNWQAIKARVISVQARFTYKSATGRQYKLVDTLQVQELTDDWLSAYMLGTQDHPDRILPRIAKALENLRRP